MNYSTLMILGIFAVSIFSISGIASAETNAKSTNFEKTTLVEFTNNDASEIQTVRMWLGKDSGEFKSSNQKRVGLEPRHHKECWFFLPVIH